MLNLNRTFRTLSATRNRLNLGTRSFALVAEVYMGQDASRIRDPHPQDQQAEPHRAGISRPEFRASKPIPSIGGIRASFPGLPKALCWIPTGPAAPAWLRPLSARDRVGPPLVDPVVPVLVHAIDRDGLAQGPRDNDHASGRRHWNSAVATG